MAKIPSKAKQPGYDRPLPFPVFGYSPLTLPERIRLREIINDPVFNKVIRNAHCKKPTTGPEGVGIHVKTDSLLIANNRLHQLQGWEMFEAALFSQAEEKVQRTITSLVETYPSEGNYHA